MRRFPVAVVVVGSFVAVVPFHWRNVRHHSNRSHFASYGHRTTEREGEEEEEGADTFFTVLFYAKRDFRTIHSFFWPVRQPASIRSPPAHNGGRSGRPAEERRAGQCNFMLFTEWRFKVDLAKWDGCSDNFIVMAYLVIDFVMGWVPLSLRHARCSVAPLGPYNVFQCIHENNSLLLRSSSGKLLRSPLVGGREQNGQGSASV